MTKLISLLPPHATQLEASLCKITERFSEILSPSVIRDNTSETSIRCNINQLWDVSQCPAEFLPWLAWGLAVSVWDQKWPEERKRAVIKNSAIVHSQKGTISAIKEAVKPFGISAHITEWWEDKVPTERHKPYHFYIDLFVDSNLPQAGSPDIDDTFLSNLRQVIDAAKPLRSTYEIKIGITLRLSSNLNIACCMSAFPILRSTFLLERKEK